MLGSQIDNARTVIVPVGNKIDLADNAKMKKEFGKLENAIFISAKEKQNTDKLLDMLPALVDMGKIDTEGSIVTNARHFEALSKADDAIIRILKGLKNEIPGDLLSSDIRSALHHLGEITGEVTSDEILGNIFSRFCVGK